MKEDSSEKMVILVTGGTGLLGQGLKWAVENRGPIQNEIWHFIGSKDADLRCVYRKNN